LARAPGPRVDSDPLTVIYGYSASDFVEHLVKETWPAE